MRLSFFGAAPDTGNLGVTALCYATLFNILKQAPGTEITVFDYGCGRERLKWLTDHKEQSVFRQGGVYGRNPFSADNLRMWSLLSTLGGVGNVGLAALKASDAVIDISAGDSFSDIYGPRFFNGVICRKLLALKLKKRLILLPQTYGPFKSKACEKKAAEIVKQSTCAWARDARSFEILKGLLGSAFDPEIHHCGVDVAFGLPTIRPASLSKEMENFFAGDCQKIGINVSGLIHNNFDKTKEQFGFKADYPKAVLGLVQRFLDKTDCKIALISHVVAPKGSYESDLDACQAVLSKLDAKYRDRVMIMPEYDNPCEIKWVISKLDWFCGTRMHATIAALSSGVPVATISYSPKALGVFESCGQGDHVADPKVMDNDELLECVWKSWQGRLESKREYDKYLPQVKSKVAEQVRSILDVI